MNGLPFRQITDKRGGRVAVGKLQQSGMVENAAYPLPDFFCRFQCAPLGDMFDYVFLYRLPVIL